MLWKNKVCISLVDQTGGAYAGFCRMKWLQVFLHPQDGIQVNYRVTPSIQFAGIHLYNWMERHCECEESYW